MLLSLLTVTFNWGSLCVDKSVERGDDRIESGIEELVEWEFALLGKWVTADFGTSKVSLLGGIGK